MTKTIWEGKQDWRALLSKNEIILFPLTTMAGLNILYITLKYNDIPSLRVFMIANALVLIFLRLFIKWLLIINNKLLINDQGIKICNSLTRRERFYPYNEIQSLNVKGRTTVEITINKPSIIKYLLRNSGLDFLLLFIPNEDDEDIIYGLKMNKNILDYLIEKYETNKELR